MPLGGILFVCGSSLKLNIYTYELGKIILSVVLYNEYWSSLVIRIVCNKGIMVGRMKCIIKNTKNEMYNKKYQDCIS